MITEFEKHAEHTINLFKTDLAHFDFEECQKLALFCVIMGMSASEAPYFDDDIVNNCEELSNIVSSNLDDKNIVIINKFIRDKIETIMEDNNIDREGSFTAYLEKLLSGFDNIVRENCLVFIYEYLVKDDLHLYSVIDDFEKFAKEEILLRFILASAGVSSDRTKGRIEEFYNLVKEQQLLEATDEGVNDSENEYYEDGDLIPGVSEDEVNAARAILARGFEALQGISDEERAILTKVMLAFSHAGHLFGGPDDSDTN